MVPFSLRMSACSARSALIDMKVTCIMASLTGSCMIISIDRLTCSLLHGALLHHKNCWRAK